MTNRALLRLPPAGKGLVGGGGVSPTRHNHCRTVCTGRAMEKVCVGGSSRRVDVVLNQGSVNLRVSYFIHISDLRKGFTPYKNGGEGGREWERVGVEKVDKQQTHCE